jgi:hypothetical protein
VLIPILLQQQIAELLFEAIHQLQQRVFLQILRQSLLLFRRDGVAMAAHQLHQAAMPDEMEPIGHDTSMRKVPPHDSAGSTDDLTGSAASVARMLPSAVHRSLPGQWHTVDDETLAAALMEFFTDEAGA